MVTRARTPEEIEQERIAREQAQQSIFAWFNPFNWGLGGMLLAALVGFGVYYFGFTDQGKAMIGEAFNGLPPEWQTRLSGWAAKLGLLPEGVGDAVAADPAAAQRARQIAQDHGVSLTGGAKGFLQSDVLYDLITKEPDFVLRIVRGLPKGGSEDQETTRAALTAVRGIIADGQKLTTLLSPAHRATISGLVEALSPVPFAPGALGHFIETVGLKNNQPTPALKQFLNQALTEDPAARNRALLQFLSAAPGGEVARLLQGVALDKITDAALREQLSGMVALANRNPNAIASAVAIERDFQQRGGTSLSDLQGHVTSMPAMVGFLLNGDNRRLIEPHIGKFATILETQAATLPDRLPNGQPNTQKLALEFLSTSAVNAHGGRQAVNLRAIHQFFQTVGSVPANQHDGAGTHATLSGMLSLMTSKPGTPEQTRALSMLDAKKVATFFHEPRNAQAFAQLLVDLRETELPVPYQRVIRDLRAHWGNADHGLAEIMGDEKSVAFFLKSLRNPSAAPMEMLDEMSGVRSTMARYMVPTRFSGVTQNMADNWNDMAAIQRSLVANGLVEQPAAQPAPSPAPHSGLNRMPAGR